MIYLPYYHHNMSAKKKINILQYIKEIPTAQKIIVVYCLLMLWVTMTMPIVNLQAIQTQTWDPVMLFSGAYLKTSIVFLATILLLLFWSASQKWSTAMSLLFWVSEAVLSFFCHLVLIALFYSIWESLALVNQEQTQTVFLTTWYYVVWWLLIIWLIITILLLLKQTKQKHQSMIINMANQQNIQSNNKETFKNLFES